MPSANMRTNNNTNTSQQLNMKTEFTISPKDVEGLVLEIKENLRVSATTLKALPCSHISRKSSRASPYRVPAKFCTCDTTNCESCTRRQRREQLDSQENPYELLQKLLKDGSLVNEAVRRVKLGLSPKQRYFYESDDESSPMLHLYAKELE